MVVFLHATLVLVGQTGGFVPAGLSAKPRGADGRWFVIAGRTGIRARPMQCHR